MAIEISAYKKLKYTVYALSEKSKVLNKWPELKNIHSFSLPRVKIDKEKTLRYILLMYDINTPLMSIKSIKKRKMEAAKISGFELDKDGKLGEDVMTLLILCKDSNINKAILDFSKMHRSFEWETYITLQTLQYRNQQALLDGTMDDSSKYTSKDLYEDAKRLDEVRNDLLLNDKTKSLAEAMHEYTLAELGLRPEDTAERLMKGYRVVSEDYYE